MAARFFAGTSPSFLSYMLLILFGPLSSFFCKRCPGRLNLSFVTALESGIEPIFLRSLLFEIWPVARTPKTNFGQFLLKTFIKSFKGFRSIHNSQSYLTTIMTKSFYMPCPVYHDYGFHLSIFPNIFLRKKEKKMSHDYSTFYISLHPPSLLIKLPRLVMVSAWSVLTLPNIIFSTPFINSLSEKVFLTLISKPILAPWTLRTSIHFTKTFLSAIKLFNWSLFLKSPRDFP